MTEKLYCEIFLTRQIRKKARQTGRERERMTDKWEGSIRRETNDIPPHDLTLLGEFGADCG